MTVTPDTPLTQFPGVGEVRAKKLSHLGLNTAGDLLTYYPRDYEDRRQVYAIRQAHHLAAAEFALTAIHFPPDDRALDLARRRLAFEELFYLAVGLAFLKRRRTTLSTGCPIPALPVEQFAALLPFTPTDAQRRTMEEAARDMACGRPMNRLVQGDVGSGKTVVAAYAGWLAVQGGFQAAMMAPTEVLAEQHFRTLSALLSPAGVRVGLLTGAIQSALIMYK